VTSLRGWPALDQPLLLFRRHKHFVKDVATLMTGKGAALAVTFVSTPIISRLFDPADFGVGALFTSLVTIAATLATLSWERAAIVAKEDRDAIMLSRLALLALVATCVLLWTLGLAATALGIGLPYADTLGRWAWALPAGLLLLGLTQIADSWLTRIRSYRRIAASDLASSSSIGGARIASGAAFGSSVWGVITGYMFGMIVEIAVLFPGVRAWAHVRRTPATVRELRDVAARYRDFPLFSAPNSFVKMLSQDLPTVMFAAMFSPAVVGFYAMASRLARLPLKLAAQALQRVVLQRLAGIANEGRSICPAYTKVTVALAALALPPFLLLWLFGDTLLTLFLGPRWEVAGDYVVILVPWLYALWVSHPASTVMTVLRRQRLLLQVQVALAVARIAVFALALARAASPATTLQAFVAVSCVASFSSVIATFVIARNADRARLASG
jgi:lipopolysaccharide exporter